MVSLNVVTNGGRRMPVKFEAGSSLAPFRTLLTALGVDPNGEQAPHNVRYCDDEGDIVNIRTDAEAREAFRVAESLGKPLLVLVDRETVPVPPSTSVVFFVNGEREEVSNPAPNLLLVDYLRNTSRLTGTKIGCGEGGCGCCAVSVRMWDPAKNCETVKSINSCLQLVCAMDGFEITTVEGLGSSRDGYHELQQTIAQGNGTQCGYCTPGMVMSMFSLLENNADPSATEIEHAFDGNLCRCTGYRPILQSFRDGAMASKALASKKGGCCGGSSGPQKIRELKTSDPSSGDEYYRVCSIAQFFNVFADNAHKPVSIISGNTGRVGVAKYFPAQDEPKYPMTLPNTVLVDISKIPELNLADDGPTGLCVGANVSLSSLIALLELSGESSAFAAAARHLKQVAGTLVRNIGSWGGNIMLSQERQQFPSDVRTVFAALGAQLTVVSEGGHKLEVVSIPELLNMDMKGKLLTRAFLPSYQGSTLFKTYRTALRHANSGAIVNMGLRCNVDRVGVITSAEVFVGGVNDRLLHAQGAASVLMGGTFDQATLDVFLAQLEVDARYQGGLVERAHASSFRINTMKSFAYKFFLDGKARCVSALPSHLLSAIATELGQKEDRPVSRATIQFGAANPALAPVSAAIPKIEGLQQSSGEATYTNDLAIDPRGYFGGTSSFILTEIARHCYTVASRPFCLTIFSVVVCLPTCVFDLQPWSTQSTPTLSSEDWTRLWPWPCPV
jgi:xanthine dehydrogenase/oxidase